MKKKIKLLITIVVTSLFLAVMPLGACDFNVYQGDDHENPLLQFITPELFREIFRDMDLRDIFGEDELKNLFLDLFTADDLKDMLKDIDLTEFLSEDDINDLLDRIDLTQHLTDQQIRNLLDREGIDLTLYLSDDQVNELLSRPGVDLTQHLTNAQIRQLLNRVDIREFFTQEDFNYYLSNSDFTISDERIEEILRDMGIATWTEAQVRALIVQVLFDMILGGGGL